MSTSRATIDRELITSLDLEKTITKLGKSAHLTRQAVKNHLPHTAKEMLEPSSPEYGEMLVRSVDNILQQAQDIVTDAKTENLYRTALDGLKIMGSLLVTQAKLLGHLKPDQKNSVNVHLSMSPREVAKLAEDYSSTAIEIPNAVSNREGTPSGDD